MAERRKSKRRSSILKSLDNNNPNYNDGRHFEKRRVSFNREILVKEFHKPLAGRDDDQEKAILRENEIPNEQDNRNPPDLSWVYTVEANESFYQMSTPIGMKKRRISGSTVPGRFSMIPVMEQSFIKESDFEVFEEDSPRDVVAKNKITLPEVNSEVGRIKEQFGCSPADDFGGEMKAQTTPTSMMGEVVDMSLTLEEDQLLTLSVEEHSFNRNDTMSSIIIHPKSLAVSSAKPGQDLTLFNKEEFLGAHQMDPSLFPLSLLTPPKPACDDGSGSEVVATNPKAKIVKELIKDSDHNEQSGTEVDRTVYGGTMSMTCSTSMGLSESENILDDQVIRVIEHDQQSGSVRCQGDRNSSERIGIESAEPVCENESVSSKNYVFESESVLPDRKTDKLNNTGEDMELTLLDYQEELQVKKKNPGISADTQSSNLVSAKPPLPQVCVGVPTNNPQIAGTSTRTDHSANNHPVLISNTKFEDPSHRTGTGLPNSTDKENSMAAAVSGHNNNATNVGSSHLTLPSGRAVMGKRRPIISSTAVVSKHLAIGSSVSSGMIERTPKKVTAISHMKSPYLNQSSSAKKESSTAKKKRQKRDMPYPVAVSPYNLRSSPSRSERKKELEARQGNETFLVTDTAGHAMEHDKATVHDTEDTCTSASATERGSPPISNEVLKSPQQEKSVDPNEGKDSDGVFVPMPEKEKDVESAGNKTFLIDNSQTQAEQDNDTSITNGGAIANKTVIIKNVSGGVSSPATSLPATNAKDDMSATCIVQPGLSDFSLSDSENKFDSNWMSDEFVSFGEHSSDLDMIPSNITTPTPTPTPKSISLSSPAQRPVVTSAMTRPSPLLNKIDASSWRPKARALQEHFSHSMEATGGHFDSSIRSPGVVVLDGTINQTVVEDVDISSTISVEGSSQRRWSVDKHAVDKLLSAVPGANTTLHLDVEFDQQKIEQLREVEITIEEESCTEDETSPDTTQVDTTANKDLENAATIEKLSSPNRTAVSLVDEIVAEGQNNCVSAHPMANPQTGIVHVSSSQQSSVMYLDTANYSIPLDETITLDSSPDESIALSDSKSHSHSSMFHSSSSNNEGPAVAVSTEVNKPSNTSISLCTQNQNPSPAKANDSAIRLQEATLCTKRGTDSMIPVPSKYSVHNLTLPAIGVVSSKVNDTQPHNTTLPTYVGRCEGLSRNSKLAVDVPQVEASSPPHNQISVSVSNPQTSPKPQPQTTEDFVTGNCTSLGFIETPHQSSSQPPCLHVDTSHLTSDQSSSSTLPVHTSNCENKHSFIECLEILHSRLEEIYNATSSRMSPDYSSNEQVKHLIKFYCIKTKACIYTLRCMIDYLRLNDMGDSVCDLPPTDWEEMPRLSSSDQDKTGTLMDKALWLREMARDVMIPLYKVCQDLMLSIERCFGWTITSWTEENISINVRLQIKVIVELEVEGSNAGQKIKSVTYGSLTEGGSVSSQLYQIPMNYKTVLEIPVMMQGILQCV